MTDFDEVKVAICEQKEIRNLLWEIADAGRVFYKLLFRK